MKALFAGAYVAVGCLVAALSYVIGVNHAWVMIVLWPVMLAAITACVALVGFSCALVMAINETASRGQGDGSTLH